MDGPDGEVNLESVEAYKMRLDYSEVAKELFREAPRL